MTGRTRADDISGVYDLEGNRLGDLVRIDDGPDTSEPAVFYAAEFGVVWQHAELVEIRDE